MCAMSLVTTICSLPRVTVLDLIIHMPDAVKTTNTDNSELGGKNVCRASRMSFCFPNFVTVHMSFPTTKLVYLLYLRPKPLM